MGDNTNATAYDSIGVVADGDNRIVNGAGTIGATGANTAGIGASVGTLLVENTIEATVGRNGALTAYALNTAANAGILTANAPSAARCCRPRLLGRRDLYGCRGWLDCGQRHGGRHRRSGYAPGPQQGDRPGG